MPKTSTERYSKDLHDGSQLSGAVALELGQRSRKATPSGLQYSSIVLAKSREEGANEGHQLVVQRHLRIATNVRNQLQRHRTPRRGLLTRWWQQHLQRFVDAVLVQSQDDRTYGVH